MPTQIFIYHAIDSVSEPVSLKDAADMSVVVGVDSFKEQLKNLGELKKKVVSLEDILTPKSDKAAKEDQVVLTFDDGHLSNYSLALPALLEADMVATFYVVAGFVDKKPDYVTSAQLREMAAHNMLIGSHSMTHRWLPELESREIRRELTESKALLEDILQRPVLDFALPGGHFNREVSQALRESDYRSVATSKAGVHRNGDDLFRLPRVEIRRGLSIEGFRSMFNRSKLRQLTLIEAAKTCVRNTCGLSRYMKLRRLAHRYMTFHR